MTELSRIPLDADGAEAPARCCPEAERIDGRFTSGDCPVIDVHRHKGMLRGLVLDGAAKPRALCWYPGGRLSKGKESPFDLKRAG